MKIFTKLFSGILIILAVLLIVSGVLIINANLKINMQTELENSIESHRITGDYIKTRIIYATKNTTATEEIINRAVKGVGGIKGRGLTVAMNKSPVYDEIKDSYLPDNDEGKLTYRTISKNEKLYYELTSSFTLRNVEYTIVTLSDITNVVKENNKLRHRYMMIYFAILLCGAAFAFLFSGLITKPVRRLSRASKAIADGNYSERLPVSSKDELGQLTESYNKMAQIIEEKVGELELSIKQKEDFIGAFAHETKTPMTSIIGYADLIYQGKLDEKGRREAAEIILSEGQRLQALSYKLLELSSLENKGITREDINTSEMADDIIKTVGGRINETKLDVNLEDAYLKIDYDLFKTVLLNLIDNSIKAGAKSITLTGNSLPESKYVIKVSDDGCGIPKELLERVKEAFYMVDKSRSRANHGAGLGLALCDRIIKLHNGNLDIKSTPGTGTEIEITIPYKADR